MAFLELRNVSKAYGEGAERTEVLANVSLEIEQGEFVAIVGFSGSGKTTLISLIAGLIEPDEGEILIDGKRIVGPGPERGVIFQNYSLLPWLTVYGNVALVVNHLFPAWPAKKRRAHVERYVEMVHLTSALQKRPVELSGGMRQRVAVARALAMDPEILLMDEPLSALDALTRGTLQAEIERIWREERKTAVLITNDVDEGLVLADRIIPLRPGAASQAATLGPHFQVELDRPRDRTELNSDVGYKVVRNAINSYLLEVRPDQGLAQHTEFKELALPNIEPMEWPK